ncbi:MAG: hypothetical protein SF069_09280 [Phycisphaerae bacterium]|nr:hypothetical protein [Phycisphaerae bacterium]
MSLRTKLAIPTAALIHFLMAGCDVSGLAPGLTGDSNPLLPGSAEPSIVVTPADQNIDDQEYAFLYASTANLPEASTDNDGIHGPAQIRWTIVSGAGGLNLVDPSSTATLNNAKTINTDPASDFGGAVLYFPDLGTSGEIVVKAEVIRPTNRTVINEFGEPVQEQEDIVIATAQAVIHVNDELRLKLTPPVTVLPSGGTVSLEAVLEALSGTSGQDDLNLRYEWNMTGLAGAGDLQSSPSSKTAVFTAFSEAATFTVTVKAIETLEDGTERVNGPASATVKVDPRLRTVNTFGYYLSRDESTDPAYYSVVARVFIPKVQGAISYRIVGQGMHDSAYYGTGWSWSFAGDPPTGSIPIMEEGGGYSFGLSLAGGSIASGGLAGAYGWMDSRFSGMRVIVTATVAD